MHRISDWLQLHELDAELLQDVVAAYHAGVLSASPLPHAMTSESGEARQPLGDLQSCWRELVIPALEAGFPRDVPVAAILGDVAFAPLSDARDALPHTRDNGSAPPMIVMTWRGSAADLVCLAHEAAHALQIILSRPGQMPPLPREVCAFLGECLLLDFARQRDPVLAHAIAQVWDADNGAYLGSDLDRISEALSAPGTPYQYRQNYALARLAAVALTRRGWGPWLAQIFASGPRAMDHVPFIGMAARAGDIANYLPPMPAPDPAHPAVEGYRSLGAMVLLDIDYWKGESEQSIGVYFKVRLDHLRGRTAFVALDMDQKPIGYATWHGPPEGERITLTRQAAPFGDHLVLQRALQRQLGSQGAVDARHGRSAREEQSAW